jgi:hypothetical protein
LAVSIISVAVKLTVIPLPVRVRFTNPSSVELIVTIEFAGV